MTSGMIFRSPCRKRVCFCSVPVWSAINVAGVNLKALNPGMGGADDKEDWKSCHQQVVAAATEIVKVSHLQFRVAATEIVVPSDGATREMWGE